MKTRMEKYNTYRKEIYQFNKLVNENDIFQEKINNYQTTINKINSQILANCKETKVDLFSNPIDVSKAKQGLPNKIYENIKNIDSYQYEMVQKEKNKFFDFLENNNLFSPDHKTISQDFLQKQPSYQELVLLKNYKDNFETTYKNNKMQEQINEKYGKSIEKNDVNITKLQTSALVVKHEKSKYLAPTIISLLVIVFVVIFVLVILYGLQII